MWEKPLKKTIFTLRVGDYAPQICELTYPLIRAWAHKIGAEVVTISERKFPDFPPVYEKLQIYELAQEMGNDWNIYVDSDALIHPDMFDVTTHLPKDTVCHNGNDFAGNRWRYDRFFRRDGRHIGSCNWFTIASDWCIELWKPPEDLTFSEALENIFPIVNEINSHVVVRDHLIDDYILSRNIAKYGLKFTNVINIQKERGIEGSYFWHHYTIPIEQKVVEMKKVLRDWGLT